MMAAISIDAFVAAFGYGTDNIRISMKSAFTIHTISTFSICVSLLFGKYLSRYIPTNFTVFVSAVILLSMGIIKLFDGLIKNALLKTENQKKDIHFSLKSIKFILSVYANPKSADADLSKELSPKEAAVLAITLCADGFPVGIGMGISSFPIIYVLLLNIIADELALRSGVFFGKKSAMHSNVDISWIGGALLILTSIIKFI